MPVSTQPLLFVGGYAPVGQPGLQACRFDSATGKLAAIAGFTDILNPGFLTSHPNGQWLYVTAETSRAESGDYGVVWALRYETEPFRFTALNHRSSRGDAPCHVRLDHTGKWLIVANYTSGSAGIFPIQPDGSLGEMSDFVEHHGQGPNPKRQEGPHAHSSIVTPDNRYVIVADLGLDQLVIYELDAEKGKLRPHGAGAADPGAGPRHLAFHPDGKHLYAGNELGSTVAVYHYHPADGSLKQVQVLPTVPERPADAPENTVADIHMDAGARRVYVSNRGHNSIAAFDTDPEGHLNSAGTWSCGGNWPRNFALAPGGRFMLVANQYSNEVTVLPLNGPEGVLGGAVAHFPAQGPACIEFAPNA
jgi:6-phosphogluconolactonase